MLTDDLLHRCLRSVAELNAAEGWGCPPAEQQRYARAVAALIGDPAVGDARIAIAVQSYHLDHAMVSALRDRQHPEHQAAWAELHRQVRRIVAGRGPALGLGDAAVSVEDLAQEALADLWRGIGQFRHQSRLQTWVLTVVGHCLGRVARRVRAQKRGSRTPAESLDALEADAGAALADGRAETPADRAELRLLADLLTRALGRQRDRRLAVIVQLWAVEQQTLREIGGRLRLSAGRVHALLAEAQHVLLTDPDLRAWLGDPGDGPSQAPEARGYRPSLSRQPL